MSDLGGANLKGQSDGSPRRGKKPTSLGGSLASNLGEGVLSQAGIEDSIGDLVAIQGVLIRIDAAASEGFPLRGKKKLTQSYRGDPHRQTRR